MEKNVSYDYLIIGAGIIGLTLAYELINQYPYAKVAILEKENEVAQHASGRNSGVLHAGFYYSSDSLKSLFCVEGNRLMKDFCRENNIQINHCGKVVVASNAEEVESLYELEKRGKQNGVEVSIINEEELHLIDPNAKSYQKALYSPSTASVNPKQVCEKLSEILRLKGVDFFFSNQFISASKNIIKTDKAKFKAKYLINSAGLYADKIAKQFGFSKNFVIIPFKGIYLKYKQKNPPIKTHIYPVPNLHNPFLGVHFTLTSDNELKLGPTSTPAFWRENYTGFSNFKLNEFLQIFYYESKLFINNSFNFRNLAISEIKKYNRKYFIRLAEHLSQNCDLSQFNQWTQPGIRAQLLNTKNMKLEMDFLIEGDKESLHILNAVSPAFTCSFAFAKYLVDKKIHKL